jgi:hypothetical protein
MEKETCEVCVGHASVVEYHNRRTCYICDKCGFSWALPGTVVEGSSAAESWLRGGGAAVKILPHIIKFRHKDDKNSSVWKILRGEKE